MKMIENYMKGQNQEVLAAINEVIAGIDKHESMSAEREQHLQTVLNKNSTEIGKVRGDVGILLDRDQEVFVMTEEELLQEMPSNEVTDTEEIPSQEPDAQLEDGSEE